MSVAVFLTSFLAIYGPSARREGVVVATSKTFRADVLDETQPVAVQFYAPWCGHCKALKPAWKAATKALSGTMKLVVVDADTERDLASKYNVRGFPSIKVFGAGKKKSPSDYKGGRSERELIAGLRQQAEQGGGAGAKAGGGAGAKAGGGAGAKAGGGAGSSHGSGWASGSSVVELTDASFQREVLESDDLWIVAFYAPWCGHCKNLEPEWKAAAKQLKGKGVSIGAVDATQATSVAQQFGVEGYPTIKVVHRGEASAYEGGRTAEDIVGAALTQLESLGVEAEVPQLTSARQWRDTCHKPGALCAVALLPHILDSGADGRNAYLATLKTVAKRNRRLYSFLWTEAGMQPKLEGALDRCCAGYPTLAVVSADKGRFALMREAFDAKHAASFVAGVLRGGIPTSPVSGGTLVVEDVAPWDGLDGALPEEEPLNAFDDEEVAFGAP